MKCWRMKGLCELIAFASSRRKAFRSSCVVRCGSTSLALSNQSNLEAPRRPKETTMPKLVQRSTRDSTKP